MIAEMSQVLSVLSDPALPVQHRNTLDLIAGVVFFGSPHIKKDAPENWARLTRLLQFAGKWPKHFLVLSELDAVAAASICEDFEQLGIEAPVLSIYETKPTKLKEGFWPIRQQVIVSSLQLLGRCMR